MSEMGDLSVAKMCAAENEIEKLREELHLYKDICHRIYICRNVSLNKEGLIDELLKIDSIFRTKNVN